MHPLAVARPSLLHRTATWCYDPRRNLDRVSIQRRGRRPGGAVTATFWARWSRLLPRRPGRAGRAAAVGFGVLLVLAAPALFLQLGSADGEGAPQGSTNKAAYDLLAAGFGAGFNGPLLAVVETPDGGDPNALAELAEAFAEAPGIG